jgi:hypothetical protein
VTLVNLYSQQYPDYGEPLATLAARLRRGRPAEPSLSQPELGQPELGLEPRAAG